MILVNTRGIYNYRLKTKKCESLYISKQGGYTHIYSTLGQVKAHFELPPKIPIPTS